MPSMRRDALAATMSRREFLTSVAGGGSLLLSPELSSAPDSGLLAGAQRERRAVDNIVLLWNEAALQGVRHSKLGPPMVARALAIIHTCAYDAWAAYDQHAVGTRLGR